jgi:hypothetical protein
LKQCNEHFKRLYSPAITILYSNSSYPSTITMPFLNTPKQL